MTLEQVASLDLYRRENPFRVPWPHEFRTWTDVAGVRDHVRGAGFPEPYAFSRRVYTHLRDRRDEFDLVHDNQCLGRGLLGFVRDGWPFVNTLHHPITVDRDLDLAAAIVAVAPAHPAPLVRLLAACRWTWRASCRVTSRCRENSKKDIVAQMGVASRHAAHRAGRRRPEAVPSAPAHRSACRAG